MTAARDPDEQKVFDLYDDYCHGRIERREFFQRSAAITVAGASGLMLAESLLPNYAEGMEVLFTDERIKATWVDYDSPGGNSGRMRGYLVRPTAGDGPWPAVLVIHENRGLNPYVKDVARRAATAGFLALAPDGLAPAGGYPGNDDDGRAMQRALDGDKLRQDMVNSALWLKGTSRPPASSAPPASAGAARRRTIWPCASVTACRQACPSTAAAPTRRRCRASRRR